MKHFELVDWKEVCDIKINGQYKKEKRKWNGQYRRVTFRKKTVYAGPEVSILDASRTQAMESQEWNLGES